MKPLEDELHDRLRELAAAGLARTLRPASGIDFSSNDYLGLGRDPALRKALAHRIASLGAEVPWSAPSSRLLRGETAAHAALERRLARLKGCEAALLFPSGYQANLGLVTALVGPADRVLSDAQNHASLIDALRLSGCRKVIFPHLDRAAVERELAVPHAGGRTFLLTESLFSMDGDIAPLADYAALAERHGAELLVDDAHAFGLFGPRGSGLVEEAGLAGVPAAVVATFGKALGVAGAFVAGSRVLVDYLVNRCRPFVFTTALSPLLVHAIDCALDRAEGDPGLRAQAHARSAQLRQRLRDLGVPGVIGGAPGGDGRGPIVPVVLGDNERAVAVAALLSAAGFDVRAVRPPSVAPGSARLRLSVHADHTEAEVDALAEAIARAVADLPAAAVRGAGA